MLTTRRGPYLRPQSSIGSLSLDLNIALLPLLVMAYYYYGLRPVLLALFTSLAAYAADVLCTLLRRKKVEWEDTTAVNAALLITLMMPASVPYYVPIVGSLFAIICVRQPLGGLSNNPFQEAAVGFCFSSLCYPTLVYLYTLPLQKLELFGTVSAKLVESPAITLKLGGEPSLDIWEMILGNYPGPMGATNLLVIFACLLYLLLRGCLRLYMPATFMATCGLFAFLFPRLSGSRMESVWFELLSGTLLFGAVFLVSSPFTAPKTKLAQVVYAALAGVLTMLFRYYGYFEQGLCPALLIMNAFTHTLDHLTFRLRIQLRQKWRSDIGTPQALRVAVKRAGMHVREWYLRKKTTGKEYLTLDKALEEQKREEDNTCND